MMQKIKESAKALLSKGQTTPHLYRTFFIYTLIALSIIGTKVLIARLYGQQELGIFSFFFSLVTVAFLFTSSGLCEAVTQTVVKHPGRLRSALGKTFLFIVPSTIIITVPFVITNYILNSHSLKINFVFYIVTYTLFYVTYSILRGFKKFTECSWYSLINRILFMVFIVIAARFAFSFDWVLLSLSVALCLAGVIALPSIYKLWKTTPQAEEVPTKEFLSLAVSLFMMQTGFYVLREMDIIIIPYIVNFNQLGVYSAQSSLSNIIRLIAYVFPVVVLPMAVVNQYRIKESLYKILKLLLPFSLLILLATYIFVPLLYGAEYSDRWLPIVLVIAAALLVIYSYFNSIFVGENKISGFYLKIIIIDFLISLIFNTFLLIVFVRWWGIVGAPIAISLVIVLKILVNIYGIKKLRRISPSDKSSPPSPDHKSQSPAPDRPEQLPD